MKVYGVEFKEKGKIYYFKSNLNMKINTFVILNTEKGLQFGKIKKIRRENSDEFTENLKEIVRVANKKDISINKKNQIEAKKALTKAISLSEKMKLNMKFIDSTFTFDRNQLLLTFVADNRVDFRNLAKELASIFKTRIELRQIGIRDKAKEISGVGQCGRELCCSSFLNNLESVSISMVKNQNLSLNPNKINGQCGRLLCCLNYENENYSECRKNMPSVGDIIETENGQATVTFVDILNQTYSALTTNGEKIVVNIRNCENREKNCK